jgi:hypothetical protein
MDGAPDEAGIRCRSPGSFFSEAGNCDMKEGVFLRRCPCEAGRRRVPARMEREPGRRAARFPARRSPRRSSVALRIEWGGVT